MTTRNADVLVIGAGVSGLSCAHFLSRHGLDVVVVEKNARAGGVIETRREAGYLFEVGPNSTLDSKPGLDRLVDDLELRERLRSARSVARNRYILRDGTLHALPMAPPALLKTRLFSPAAKLRIAGETLVPRRRGGDDESVADFVRRRFGREFLDYAIGPFVSGVYAGDPERLSLRSAFPPMHEFETRYGGVIKGAVRTARARKKRNAGRGRTGPAQLVTFDQGMAVLTDELARTLGDRLVLDTAAVSLEPLEGARWSVSLQSGRGASSVTARAVVVSTAADVAADLVGPLHSELGSLLDDIPYAPVASVFLGFRAADVSHSLDGFGFLVPAVEERRILGTIFSSSLFDARAPEGAVALTSFVGGMRRPELATELDERELGELVVDELREIIGVRGVPEFTHVHRWNRAIPQFALGHHKVARAIDELETQYSGLFFCANYCRGVSVGDCVDFASSLALRVAENSPSRDSL